VEQALLGLARVWLLRRRAKAVLDLRTEMQRYLLSRPLPARDIPQFLLSRRKGRDVKHDAAAA
jgi:hypothetical protein